MYQVARELVGATSIQVRAVVEELVAMDVLRAVGEVEESRGTGNRAFGQAP